MNSRYLLELVVVAESALGNKYLPYGILAVVVLQLLFTYTPPFQAMFGNEVDPALGLAVAHRGRARLLPRRGGGEVRHPLIGVVAEPRSRRWRLGRERVCRSELLALTGGRRPM